MSTNPSPLYETEDPQKPQAPARTAEPTGPLFPGKEVVVAPETPPAPAQPGVKPEEVGEAKPQRPRRQIIFDDDPGTGTTPTPNPNRVDIEDPAPFGD